MVKLKHHGIEPVGVQRQDSHESLIFHKANTVALITKFYCKVNVERGKNLKVKEKRLREDVFLERRGLRF